MAKYTYLPTYLAWKSKGLTEESFKPPTTSDKSRFKINFYS